MTISISVSRLEGRICSEKKKSCLPWQSGFSRVLVVSQASVGEGFSDKMKCAWCPHGLHRKPVMSFRWAFLLAIPETDLPSLSSYVCSIASLSIFIEFIAFKEARSIFFYGTIIFFYPVTVFRLEKHFSVIDCIHMYSELIWWQW